MKYLKLFESFYEKFPPGNFGGGLKFILFNEYYTNKFELLMESLLEKYTKDKEPTRRMIRGKIEDEIESTYRGDNGIIRIGIDENKSYFVYKKYASGGDSFSRELTIRMLEDEWFIVWYRTDDMPSTDTYRCDQWDGLLKLIGQIGYKFNSNS